jgi:Flp pilus assembly protein TadG
MIKMSKIAQAYRRTLLRFRGDQSGLAAVEFAFIVPVMLTLVFGTIEVGSVVAIDRKTTLVARTLSDLVSRGVAVNNTDLKNFFGMGGAIMSPYPVTTSTMSQRLTALTIDGSSVARVSWSFTLSGNSTTLNTGYANNMVISTVPTALLVPNTQLIWSEVNYTYYPILGYLIAKVFPMKKQENYTRPRQSVSVTYSAT